MKHSNPAQSGRWLCSGSHGQGYGERLGSMDISMQRSSPTSYIDIIDVHFQDKEGASPINNRRLSFNQAIWLRNQILRFLSEYIPEIPSDADIELERLEAAACGTATPYEFNSMPTKAEMYMLRRMLCDQYAGADAYMEDGEAQDSSRTPIIDFLRDSPDDIQKKMQERSRLTPSPT